MTIKQHIIIGGIIFIINTLYVFFAYKWSYFDIHYYIPAMEFLEKVAIIAFIIILLLKWTKLLAISKRYIYIYVYYVIISYSSGVFGDILGIFFNWKLVKMGF